MKNKILLPLLALLFAAMFISCDNDNEIEEEKENLEIDKTAITLTATGDEQKIALTANGLWEIESIPEWLVIDPAFGDKSTTVNISAKQNNGDSKRNTSLVFTRGKITRTLEVEQLSRMDGDPFIELDKDRLEISQSGKQEIVKITSNCAWQITNIPAWITVNPTEGIKSAEVVLTIKENRSPEARAFELLIKGGNDIEQKLFVYQSGLKDYIQGPTLPIFKYSRLTFTSARDDYSIEAKSLLVNPSIKDKIYLGNLISHNAGSHLNIPVFTGYTFNPVTVSTSVSVGGTSDTFEPSWAAQDAFAQEIIKKISTQKSVSEYNDVTEFYDYRQLRAVGIANLGVELDVLISGKSYKEQEMKRKYGMIYSFKRKVFGLDVDLPDKLIKEELKAADRAKGVSYVASVDYGNLGLLIVESDTDSRDLQAIIDKVVNTGYEPTAEEKALLDAADISYVYFNNNVEEQIKRGHLDVVKAYKKAKKEGSEYIHPLEFTLLDFDSHELSVIKFSFQVPK